jgi:hypothetical protein
MQFDDTGMNVAESVQTLKAQQARLVAGKRHVQMFPLGSAELPVPEGCLRHENERGAFHYRPSEMSPAKIDRLSRAGRENEMLELGPFNKSDIHERLKKHESLFAVVEFDPNGVEVRAAAGTTTTIIHQLRYFDATKDLGSTISICDLSHLMMQRTAA